MAVLGGRPCHALEYELYENFIPAGTWGLPAGWTVVYRQVGGDIELKLQDLLTGECFDRVVFPIPDTGDCLEFYDRLVGDYLLGLEGG